MHCPRPRSIAVLLVVLFLLFSPSISAERVDALLSERGTELLVSPEQTYEPMPSGTTLPFVVFRQYTDEAEDFLDEVGALMVGTSFSTNGSLELPQAFTSTMQLLGIDTNWDTSALEPISEDERTECSDTAMSYSVAVTGTLEELDHEFNEQEGTLDVYLETDIFLSGSYTKWSFYEHTWSDDFWYCLGHPTRCSLNLGGDCEASCGGLYCPWLEVNFSYWAEPLMLTYQYEMSFNRGVGTMNLVDTNYHDALNAVIGFFVEGDNPGDNPFAVFASPLEMLIDMAVYHDVDGQYGMTLPDAFADSTVSAEVQIDSSCMTTDALDTQVTVDYDVVTTGDYSSDEEPNLDSTSGWAYGVGIPEGLPNILFDSAYRRGDFEVAVSNADQSIATDLWPGMDEPQRVRLELSLGHAPSASFESDGPRVEFDSATLSVLIDGDLAVTITADVEMDLEAELINEATIKLRVEDTNVTHAAIDTETDSSYGRLDGGALYDLLDSQIVEQFFSDGIPVVRQPFNNATLWEPADAIKDTESGDGWLNVYLE